MKPLDFDTDYAEQTGYNGRAYYKLATVTWSDPVVWDPSERRFPVPAGWAGHGGVYAFTRQHWRQEGKPRIAYIGKAKSFTSRLTNDGHLFRGIMPRRIVYPAIAVEYRTRNADG